MDNKSRKTVLDKLLAKELDWTDYLQFASRMWAYPYSQVTAIYNRDPTAIAVMSEAQWQKYGFKTNYRAKPIILSGVRYYDIQSTNAPRDFGSWNYTPEVDSSLFHAWEKSFPGMNIADSVVANAINLSTYNIKAMETRYQWNLSRQFRNFISDSTAYAILSRLNVDTSDCDFDFSNAAEMIADEPTMQTIGQIIQNVLHNAIYSAKKVVVAYNKQLEATRLQQKIEEENKALLDEYSERLFLFDLDGKTLTCKVEDVQSPFITVSDTEDDTNRVTILISEFDKQAKEYIPDEVQEALQDNKEELPDDDLIAFAEKYAEIAVDNPISDKQDDLSDEGLGTVFYNTSAEQLSFFDSPASADVDSAGKTAKATKSNSMQEVKPKQRRGRKAKEKRISPAPLVITPDMEDHVLRCGANKRDSLERIVAWFQKGKSDEENAAFLQAEFTDSIHRYHDTYASRGYIFRSEEYPEGVHISAAFSDRLIITSGDTASLDISPFASVSWILAARRVKSMLEKGEYCPQEIIDRAEEYELKTAADALWHLHQNTNKQIYDFFIPDETINHVFPEGTARLKISLQNKETLQEYINGLEKFISDSEQNEDILRFKQFTPTLQELLSSLKDLRIERRQFTANPDFKFTTPEFFFTENEIDHYLTTYQPYSQGKFRINEYFIEDHSRKEQASFLQKLFGQGGSYSGVCDKSYDSKGMEITYGSLYGSEPITIRFSWTEVAEHIDNAVREERYITQEDIDDRIWHSRYTVEHYDPENGNDYDKREYEEAVSFLVKQGVIEGSNTVDTEDSNNIKSVLPSMDTSLVKGLLKTEYMGGNTRLMKNSKDSVVDFFAQTADYIARTQYISETYDKGVYTETTVSTDSGDRRVGFNADDSGMIIWEGNYLSRTNESFLTWSEITELISDMIEDNTYYSTLDQSVSLMTDAVEVTEVAPSADTVAEIKLKYQGDSESLEEIRNKALSLGAIVLIDNAKGTIDIDTYENHREEIDSLADELGLKAVSASEEKEDNYAITIHKVGNFYEIYGDDARLVSASIGLYLSRKNGTAMCGFPDKELENYIAKINEAGYSVIDAEQAENNTAKVSDLSVGDVIMYDGTRREVTELSADSIKLKDLDHDDFDGVLISTSDVLNYDGWQEDMESKGFEIISKAESNEPVAEISDTTASEGEELYNEEVFAFDNAIRYYIIENDEHHFNVQVQTKSSDSDTYVYSGVGRFTDTLDEAHNYIERDIQLRTVRNSFNDYYDILYNEGDAAVAGQAGYELALMNGDRFIKEQKNPVLVSDFNELRGDIISSDREVASFAFALQDAGLIERFIPERKSENLYEIYQLKNNAQTLDIRFVSLDRLHNAGLEPELNNYEKVYEGDFSEFVTKDNTIEQQLNALYTKFNVAHPSDYKGHSLSISDVVVINETAYYTDTFGFEVIDNFIPLQNRHQKVDRNLYADRLCEAVGLSDESAKQYKIIVSENRITYGMDELFAPSTIDVAKARDFLRQEGIANNELNTINILEHLYQRFEELAERGTLDGRTISALDALSENDRVIDIEPVAETAIEEAPASDVQRPRARILDVTANRNYKHLLAAFPQIMEHQYSYMQFSAGEAFDKLNLEWISRSELAISHTYVQNGDLMRDPEIVLSVNKNDRTVFPVEYQNDSLGLYGRYEEGDAKSKDCNAFLRDWLRNIDAQGYSLIRSVRFDKDKQEDVSKDYELPLEEERFDLIFKLVGGKGTEIYNRLDIVSDDPVTYRTTARIDWDFNITYFVEDIPDYYKAEIESYAQRSSQSAELVSAYTLIQIFNSAKAGEKFDDKYDLLSVAHTCKGSALFDNDLIDFIGRVISNPSDISIDDYDYAISMVSDIIDEHQDEFASFTSDVYGEYYGARPFITDEETVNEIFNKIISAEKVHREFSVANDVSETPNRTPTSAPVTTDSNPLDLTTGDVITVGGNDRQYVITSIDNDASTAVIRDDNRGESRLFEDVSIDTLTAATEQNEMQHSFDPDDDSIDDDSETPNNYIISDDNIGVATPKIRAEHNIAAIEIVNTILKEHRDATDEEKNTLAQYVGWGSLPDVFDERKDNFLSERSRLQELLSDKEYQSARESTLTAFYTQPVIIRAIYKALGNMGFEGGKILEPAMGVGNFFGAMPQELAENSQLYGVEIDRITGNIAKQLYPNANISVKGFEEFKAPDNSFDVVIGNVPFADFKVFDTRYNKHNLLIHDYFFAKAIDKVKPGGIVAFITSKGTLDKQNSKFRRLLCEKSELLGAIRLPSTAFKANAGTEAISDIIFLKKRNSIETVKDNWVNSAYSYTAQSYINTYFIENPDMICGELSSQSTQYGYDIDVKPFEGVSLEDALMERIEKIQGKFEPINKVLDLDADSNKDVKYISLIDDSIPPYRYGQLSDGTIVYREGDRLRVENIAKNSVKYYQAAIRLSNAVRTAITVQQAVPDGINDKIINENFENARAELNEAYDAFAKTGIRINIHYRRSKFYFDDDFNFGLMKALEKEITKPDGKKEWVKSSDLFERRTIVRRKEITHCDTINDAFLVSLNVKSRIDIDYICKLTDKQPEEVIGELNGSYMYRNPQTYSKDDINSGWETADEYLSGNIRTKLLYAKDAAAADTAFAINVTALEGVMPEKIPASEIAVQLGSSWVPVEVVEDFMNDVFEFPGYMKYCRSCEIEHHIPTATWHIKNKAAGKRFSTVYELYGTERITGMELLEDSLNMRRTTIYDRVEKDGNMVSVKNPEETQKARLKQDMLKQAFTDWVWKDAERTRLLETIYNEKYNSERVRRFDGSHLTFDDMNTTIELQPHQKNAVARILYGGNSLLAHVVGAGKTYEITAACMELKRTGAANKSLIVVPNHLIGQWGKEFQTLYPGANILLANSDDFKKENRKRFLGRIATGDYDAIIMGYSTFGKIGISVERRRAFYQDELDACCEHLKNVEDRSLSEKQLNRLRKQLEGKLKSLEYVVSQDKEITFEELGVDWLYIDEAHNFKNLILNTKLGQIAGISTSNSKRAEDLLLKIRYINEMQGGERGVVLATGTPISNSLVEMYTMQRYLQVKYLEEKGINHFDAWAADFAKIESTIELDPTGVGFRNKTRCAAFNNLPELMVMFNRCTDIQTAEMLNLPVPKLKDGQYTICVCQPSEEQQAYVKDCGKRAERIHANSVDPSVDNMLKVTNDGKMCALDMRLIDPDAEDRPDSKINVAIENIYDKWAETKSDRLTQIVFLDRSTPKQDEFNLYDDIRNKLVERGVPKSEVRFIHEAKNDTEKLKLFDEVNSGLVRIIIGSTEKMGAGTNIQERLCALHHIDVPWRPSDIEQREGRILRRGNINEEVEIFRYVTEKTFDSYSWQTIESKQKFISQVMTGNAAGRSAEDVDNAVLNYAQIKALATGDPRIKEHFDLTEEVNRLRMIKGAFDKSHIEMRDKLCFILPKKISAETNFVKMFKAEKEYIAENSKPFNEESNPFTFTINTKCYDKREDAGMKILEIVNSGAAFNQPYALGKYRGFDLSVAYSAAEGASVFHLKHIVSLQCEVGNSSIGMFKRLDNLIDARIDFLLGVHSKDLTACIKDMEACKQHANEEFPQKEELAEKEKRLAELTKELAFDNHSEGDNLADPDNEPIINNGDSGRK